MASAIAPFDATSDDAYHDRLRSQACSSFEVGERMAAAREPRRTDMFRSWPRLSESLEPVHRGRLRSDGMAREDAWLVATIASSSLASNTLRPLQSMWRPARSMPVWQRTHVCTSGMACSRVAEIASPHSRQVPYAPSLIRSSAADRRFTRSIRSSRVAKPTSRLSLAWSPSTSSAEGPLSRIVQGRSSIAAAPRQVAKSRDRRLQVLIEPIPDVIHGRPPSTL